MYIYCIVDIYECTLHISKYMFFTIYSLHTTLISCIHPVKLVQPSQMYNYVPTYSKSLSRSLK